jgi:hypothetical protein
LGLKISLEKKSRSLSNLKIVRPFGGVENIKEPKFYFIPQDLWDFATEQDFD